MIVLVWVLTLTFGVCSGFMLRQKRVFSHPFVFCAMLGSFLVCLAICFAWIFVKSEDLLMALLCLFFGALLPAFGAYDIYNIFSCKQQISAEYQGFNRYSGSRGAASYAPVFEYEWQGKRYTEQSAQSEKLELLEAEMEVGQTYPIYINPQNPSIFLLARKFRFISFLMFVLGLFFLLGGWALLAGWLEP